MKQNKNKTQKKRAGIRPVLFGAGAAVVAVLVGLQLWFNLFLYRQQALLGVEKIQFLIVDAVRGLSREVPRDPQSGQLYIPEARLTLPPSDEIGTLRYSYSKASEGFSEEVRLASQTAISSGVSGVVSSVTMEETFQAVPKLQACSRQFMITFGASPDDTDGYELQFQKPLADGRTANLLLSIDCSDFSDELTDYLRNIDSY